jgi:hypothetical protein
MTRKFKVTCCHYHSLIAYIENRYGWVDGTEGPDDNVPSLVNITSWQLLLEVLVPDENERALFNSTPGFPDINKYPFLASQEALENAIQDASSNISAEVNSPEGNSTIPTRRLHYEHSSLQSTASTGPSTASSVVYNQC